MPDASRGVPLWRTLLPHGRLGQSVWTHSEPVGDTLHEDGLWYPAALAEARERVVEAARKVVVAIIAKVGDPVGATDQYGEALAELMQSTASLDALEGADTEGGTNG